MPLPAEDLSPIPASLSWPRRPFARRSVDIGTVLGDQLTNMSSWFRRVRSGVGDGAAKPHVVPNEVGPLGVRQEVIDVRLANPEPAVDVSSVVSFLMIAHRCALESS